MQERITFDGQTQTNLLQTHLSRYVWAMNYCTGKRFLDIGCGVGYGTWLLGQAGNGVGIDVAAEAVQSATETFNGTFVQVPMEEFQAEPFDTIVSFEVIEHCTNLDVAFAKIVSLLKPDGVALISLPVHQGANPWHHNRDFTYAQWWSLISQHLTIRNEFYQWVEGRGPTDVCIVPVEHSWNGVALDESGGPESGIIIFVCGRPE